MRLKVVFLLVIVAVVLSACAVKSDSSNNSDEVEAGTPTAQVQDHGFIGYVVKKEAERMLVVSPDVTDYSSSGGQKNFYSAIWFSAVPSTIDIGMKVEVWSVGGGVADSYPQQGKSERVTVISNTVIEGSQLLEAEAVKKAISSLEIGEDSFSVVKEVQFDPTASIWTVSVLNEKRDKIIPIQIPDRK